MSSKEKLLEDTPPNELHVHKESLQNPYALGVFGASSLAGAPVPRVPYYLVSTKSSAATLSAVSSLIVPFAAVEWNGELQKRRPKRGGL